MALSTPEQWLPVLAERLDRESAVVGQLRNYVNGNAPLPEAGAKTKATWLAFQRKALTNYGGIACTSRANRIRYRDVRVGDDDQSDVSKAARRIARDNRLPMQVADAVWDMLSARRGYLVAGRDAEGRAVITSEKPELFYAEPDPVYPWKVRAAIKVWRDTVERVDYALVWVPGGRQEFFRPSFTDSDTKTVRLLAVGDWMPAGDLELYDGAPPVWIMDRRDGMGLIEPHTSLIDRMNTTRLQRLSTMAIQAFRQRALKKSADAPPVPDKDANGQPIKWEEVFEPAPGALWDLPEGVELWESQTTDITPMLAAEKADAREFSAVTGLNISVLMPDSANQTAEGARNTTQMEIDDCAAMIDRITLAVAACLLTSLRIEGIEPEGTIEVAFEPPGAVSVAEQFDALSKGIAAGISLATLQKHILGWSADMIAEDDTNRRRMQAREQLAALAGAAPQPVVTGGNAG